MSKLERAINLASFAIQFAEVHRVTAHPDGRPESDATHTVMLSLLACELAPPWMDRGLLCQMSLVHDLAEAYVGDTDTSRGLTEEQAESKSIREEKARVMLGERFGRLSWVISTLDRYEAQDCHESRYIRVLDKVLPKLVHHLNGGRVMKHEDGDEVRRVHDTQFMSLQEQYQGCKIPDSLWVLLEDSMALCEETFRLNKADEDGSQG